jgi:hypothetical protein
MRKHLEYLVPWTAIALVFVVYGGPDYHQAAALCAALPWGCFLWEVITAKRRA